MEKVVIKSPFNNKYWILFLAAFCALFLLLANRLGGAPVGAQVLFLLSQIAFVLIPGMALLLYLNVSLSGVKFFVTAYLLGVCIVIAEYFVFFAIGLKDYILVALIIVSALCLLCLWRKRAELKQLEWNNTSAWAFSALLAALMLVVLFTAVSSYNIPGGETDLAYIYQDQAWNTGNVSALASGLPVNDIHIDGLSFGYHYLASAFLAVFKNALTLSSYFLYLRMMPAVQAAVFAGGLYLLFSMAFKNKWAAAGAALVAAFCSIAVAAHFMWYAYATATGLGLALAAAYFFLRWMKGEKLWNGDFILFLIFLAAATGTKAMMAAGVLAGAGVVLIVQIFRRKNVKNNIVAGIATLLAFGAVYAGLVYGAQAFNSMQWAFATPMWLGDVVPPYYSAALEAFPTLSTGLVKLITYPLFMVEKYPALVAALVFLLMAMIRGRGDDRRVELFLFAGILACFAASSILYQPGLSNLLFMEGAMPLCAFALCYCTIGYANGKQAKKTAKIALCCITVFVLVWTVSMTMKQLRWEATEGLPSRFSGPAEVDSISAGEYEGMVWMKENAPEDAVFATDRRYFSPQEDLFNARYYYYTAFAERQCYLEGYNYVSTRTEGFEEIIAGREAVVRAAYGNDPEALQQLISDGVDYLVASYYYHPGFELDPIYGELVFGNGGVRVFKLTGK